MKRLALALWLALAPIAALAQGSDLSNPQTDQSQLTRNKGQLPGTATNDSASAGNVGQIITNSTTGTSISNSADGSATSVTITAGDWDVWCTFKFTPAATTTITGLIGEVTPTSATLALTLGNYHRFSFEQASAAGNTPLVFSTPVVPVSLSGSTSYFCTANATFAISTMTVDGKIVARRRR